MYDHNHDHRSREEPTTATVMDDRAEDPSAEDPALRQDDGYGWHNRTGKSGNEGGSE